MESSPARRWPARLTAAALLLAGASLPAQDPQPTFELPKYAVTAERELPPPEAWTYARLEGFEVLSNASESATRQLLADFQRFSFALNLVWPGQRPPGEAVASLLICGRKEKFEELLPDALRRPDRASASFHVRTRDQAILVLDHQTKILNLAGTGDEVATATPEAASASDGGEAGATDEAGVIPQGFAIDAHQQLYREYLHFLLSARPAPAPAWLAEGLSQLFMNLRLTETEIAVGRVEDPNLASDRGAGIREDRDFNAALSRRALLPMAELLAVAPDSPVARNPLDNAWAKQCYAFVHWGLYGDYGRNKQAFGTFVTRLEREPLSEALFKECFRRDYAGMLQALRNHIEFTRTKVEGVRADAGQKLPYPPDPVVRPATQAEAGRLLGDALMLTGHPDAGRVALVDAYRRGERDPGLLAALGLAELATRDADRARKFLEAAFAAKAIRPRAHVELARLRLGEAQAKPAAAGGRLDAAQVARVLEPLKLARVQVPALPETYRLIGAVWRAGAVPPPAAQIPLLAEGVRLFPRDGELVYDAAEWHAHVGLGPEARALIALGLKVANDPALRARFEALLATLPPAKAGKS